MWNKLLLPAHLQEGTNFHLGILLLDFALAEDNAITVHILVNMILEEVFKRLQISQVYLNRLLRQDVDSIWTHFGRSAANKPFIFRFLLINEHLGEHRLEGILFMCIQSLCQIRHGKIKVVVDKDVLVINVEVSTILDTAIHSSLLERSVEDVETEFIADHVSLDAENDELGQVHCTILK